ncbi:sterile alpha motif domain-containing protein 1 isoform X2 [Osmerus mordax]|uniref:sterile alpha motif domain-containing protein 1 isoform X2 n=1 Tax=Osmerus mordax TaxID=8014 RepID=UPI00350F0662
MSEPKYRDWILETIDSLRSRKARPDLERICRMVRRRHGSDPDRTRAELEKLIQEQTVLKVSYKGSISYRNAAKVQRKSRKKNEFTPGGGAETTRERGKHAMSNNGDSAHSFSDPEEDDSVDKEDSEPSPSPDPRTQTTVIMPEDEQKTAPSTSGNGCLGCGATGCAAGSGCEEKASATRDKRLGQTGSGIPSHGHEINTPVVHDASSKTKAARGGVEPGSCGGKLTSSSSGADGEKQSCPESAGSNSILIRQQQPAAHKTKLQAGGGAKGDQDNSDLGDRLVASVRSLAERNRGTATTRGHKPLGLKEILGYLSGQERLSEEKLTRSKVKVVLEKEVSRGRLHRTRCGNITLPSRGAEKETVAKAPAARLLKSALQEKHVVKKEELKREEEEEEAKQDEEGAGLSNPQRSGDEDDPPVAMETEPGRPDDITEGSEALTPVPNLAMKPEATVQPCSKGESEAGSPSRAVCPSVQRGVAPGCEGVRVEESAVTPDQIQSDGQSEGGSHTSSDLNSCKMEVGVSSCLLTPTASPRDSALPEERRMNGDVVKAEGVRGSLVLWTVSDVVRYFTEAGFPEQALAFRTQEIDGKSLLLMQRNDVLTGLSIRLGPALKIYERHVKVLQRAHFEEDEDC